MADGRTSNTGENDLEVPSLPEDHPGWLQKWDQARMEFNRIDNVANEAVLFSLNLQVGTEELELSLDVRLSCCNIEVEVRSWSRDVSGLCDELLLLHHGYPKSRELLESVTAARLSLCAAESSESVPVEASRLFSCLGHVLPNLKVIDINSDQLVEGVEDVRDNSDYVHFPMIAAVKILENRKIASQLEVLRILSDNGINTTLSQFQEFTKLLQKCPSLVTVLCQVGEYTYHEDVDDENIVDMENDLDLDIDEDVDDAEMGDDPEDVGAGHEGVSDLSRPSPSNKNNVYFTWRPQDLKINECWDTVIRALASGCSRTSLRDLRLFTSIDWTGDTLLKADTTQALLNVEGLVWPLAPGPRPNVSFFPFTLNLSGTTVSLGTVVDYLIRVHRENGVVTHFIPENPTTRVFDAQTGTTATNNKETCVESLINMEGMNLPTFRLMYNGKEDPGRSYDIFVHLSANLVQPALIKEKLQERLGSTGRTQFLVAEELLHEPKDLLFYQGMQKYNLWHFDPATATDLEFVYMLEVLSNLGPHGSFFHKSVDYGLRMRYSLLSLHRDRLSRWLE